MRQVPKFNDRITSEDESFGRLSIIFCILKSMSPSLCYKSKKETLTMSGNLQVVLKVRVKDSVQNLLAAFCKHLFCNLFLDPMFTPKLFHFLSIEIRCTNRKSDRGDQSLQCSKVSHDVIVLFWVDRYVQHTFYHLV
jgi:hypothetical protein